MGLKLEVNTAKPIQFEGYQLVKRQKLASKNLYSYVGTSLFPSYTRKKNKTNIDDESLQTNEQQDQLEEQYAQNLGIGEIVSSQSQDTQWTNKSIISVSVKADDSKRLAKQNSMPIWAATCSLLL